MQWHKNNNLRKRWPWTSHHRVVVFHRVWMILACRACWSEWLEPKKTLLYNVVHPGDHKKCDRFNKKDSIHTLNYGINSRLNALKVKKKRKERKVMPAWHLNSVWPCSFKIRKISSLSDLMRFLREILLVLSFDQTLIKFCFDSSLMRPIKSTRTLESGCLKCLAWRKADGEKNNSINIQVSLLFIPIYVCL